MKRVKILPAIGIAIFFLVGCDKDDDPVPNPPPNPPNGAIFVNAGEDIELVLPENEVYLKGTYRDSGNQVTNISWEKIDGPASFQLENKHFLETKISNLDTGIYQFELTVRDHNGGIKKDTVVITVLPEGAPSQQSNEIILRNLEWIFPWYNSLEIPNFQATIQPGAMFRVFIQRYNSTEWIEVQPMSDAGSDPANVYEYFIETRADGAGIYHFGSLYVIYYGFDSEDSPSVRILRL